MLYMRKVSIMLYLNARLTVYIISKSMEHSPETEKEKYIL